MGAGWPCARTPKQNEEDINNSGGLDWGVRAYSGTEGHLSEGGSRSKNRRLVTSRGLIK